MFKKIINKLGYTITRHSNASGKIEYGLDIYREIYPEESIQQKAFYNVGSGDFYHPYWTNLDFVSDWYKEGQKNIVHIDLMKMEPLPINDNVAEVIYCSHTIEHIKDEAILNLFRESFRVLKKGGFIRITCPDADADYDALLRNDHHWFYWDEWYKAPGSYEHLFHNPAPSVPIEERWLHHIASQLALNDKSPSSVKLTKDQLQKLIKEMPKEKLFDHLSSLCTFQPDRPGNHISWWNAAKIEDYLRKAGFSIVYKSSYLKSNCPILRNGQFFDNTHPQMAVYVEAVRT